LTLITFDLTCSASPTTCSNGQSFVEIETGEWEPNRSCYEGHCVEMSLFTNKIDDEIDDKIDDEIDEEIDVEIAEETDREIAEEIDVEIAEDIAEEVSKIDSTSCDYLNSRNLFLLVSPFKGRLYAQPVLVPILIGNLALYSCLHLNTVITLQIRLVILMYSQAWLSIKGWQPTTK
jgi:hypothetical protein